MHQHEEEDPEDEACGAPEFRYPAVEQKINPARQDGFCPLEKLEQGVSCYKPQGEEQEAVEN